MLNNDNPNAWLQEASVTLGGLTFNGRHAPSSDGLYFSSLEGWFGLPGMKGSPYPNPTSNGNLPRSSDQQRRASRVITLSGSVSADTHLLMAGLRSAFVGVLSSPGLLSLGVSITGSDTLYSDVDVVSLEFTEDHGKPSAKFIIYMEAPDPYKYSPLITTHVTGASRDITYGISDYPEGGAFESILITPTPSADPSYIRLDLPLNVSPADPPRVGDVLIYSPLLLPIEIIPSIRSIRYIGSDVPVDQMYLASWPTIPPVRDLPFGTPDPAQILLSTPNTGWEVTFNHRMRSW